MKKYVYNNFLWIAYVLFIYTTCDFAPTMWSVRENSGKGKMNYATLQLHN